MEATFTVEEKYLNNTYKQEASLNSSGNKICFRRPSIFLFFIFASEQTCMGTRSDELNLGANSTHVQLKLDWRDLRKHHGNKSLLMHIQTNHMHPPLCVGLTCKSDA